MKKIALTLTVVVLALLETSGQQDPLYTQYRSNMISVNPAYAGSRDALTVSLLYRNQWVGIEGAPTTQTISVHGPMFNRNLAFGAAIVNDVIGPTRQTGLYGDFAGRIKVGSNSYLAGGIKIGFNFFRSGLTDLSLRDQGDQEFSQNTVSVLPNIGAGVYYYGRRFYAGVSTPKIFQNQLYSEGSDEDAIREKRHYFFITGLILDLSPNLKFKPALLARFVSGAPGSYDLTGSFIISDRLWLGGYYRYEESLGLLVDYNFTTQLKVGYSYDFTLTDLQQFNSGSHEISLIYDFVFQDKKIKSPRYF